MVQEDVMKYLCLVIYDEKKLMWPFFSSASFQSIHFFMVCCICSGDMERQAVGLLRNKYINFALDTTNGKVEPGHYN